jgi:peptide/nickel transport system permease protein
MVSTLRVILRFIYVVIGIILLSAFVGLFTNSVQMDASLFAKGVQMDVGLFIDNVIHIVKSLIFPENLVVEGNNHHKYSIFLNFWDSYFYSLSIFLAALGISILMGLVITYFTMLLPQKLNRLVTRVVALLESLPDLFLIMVIQFLVIYYFKQTGTLLFPVAGSSQSNTYFLPIVTLAIIPSIMLYKITLHLVNDEWEKPYIEMAKSKGFGKTRIFLSHILRNIVPSLFIHSKTMVLYILSSMVIFEKLFNIYGIISYIIRYPSPNVIAFTLIMFFLPVFLLYALITPLIEKNTGQRLEW